MVAREHIMGEFDDGVIYPYQLIISANSSEYGVMSIPTFIVFKQGNPIKNAVGVQSEEILKNITEKTGLTATCGIGPNMLLAKVSMDIENLIRRILEITSYDSIASAMENGEKRILNIELLINYAENYENNGGSGLSGFIRYLDRIRKNNKDLDGANEISENDDVVRIMSIHKSKGLEFPVVIIPGVHVGSFPNDFFIHCQNDLEQERRLFYVAMTRAVDKLYITCYQNPYGSNQNGIVRKGFISEIPELIEWRQERNAK